MNGNIELLDRIVATLKDYPNVGGDIGVMTEVDRLIAEEREAIRQQLETPDGIEQLLATTKAGRDFLKETCEERKLKTRVLDKFADYCIERNSKLEDSK